MWRMACSKGYIPGWYEPRGFDVELDEVLIELDLWDTTGDEYDRLRALSYINCSVFILCYGVDMPCTLHAVTDTVRRTCRVLLSSKFQLTIEVQY